MYAEADCIHLNDAIYMYSTLISVVAAMNAVQEAAIRERV